MRAGRRDGPEGLAPAQRAPGPDARHLTALPAAPAVHEPAERLVDVLCGLRDGPAGGARAMTWRSLGAPVVAAPSGLLDTTAGALAKAGAAVLLEGVVLRHTRLGDRVVTEVMTEGDVLDLRPDEEPCLVETTTEYAVHSPATLALLLDDAMGTRLRSPALQAALHHQLAIQCRRASTQMAILHLPRVEDRILAVFRELADRLGRVRPDGTVIDLPLTHTLIGRLVAGRRPTVSLALMELAAAGQLVRRDDGSWLLPAGAPVGAASA